jgi:peptidase E
MAADGRRHVLAVGGGMLMPHDAIPLLVKYAMELSGQKRPKLCVLNTANGDDQSAYLRFYDRLAETPARVRHLALFPIVRKAWQAGIIMAGSSAGGICWFAGGTTDSFGVRLRPFTDGLAMLAGSFCPHYNSEAERRPLYQRLVAEGSLPGGLACDDGAAAHFIDDTLAEVVCDRPGATAYRVDPDGSGGSTEAQLQVRFLGA